MDEDEDFKWDDHDEAVVIKPVQAIAVYRNPMGHVVIRQERASYQDDDPFVVVPESQLRKLIDALNSQLA